MAAELDQLVPIIPQIPNPISMERNMILITRFISLSAMMRSI